MARSASSTVRTTRTSSPFASTSSHPKASGSAGPRTSASSSACSPTRDDGRQGLPQRLARRAAQTAAGAPGQSGEGVEVPPRGPRQPRALGRLHVCLRRRVDGNLDGLGAVARRAGGSQLGPQPRRRRAPGRCPPCDRPAAARRRSRAEKRPDTSSCTSRRRRGARRRAASTRRAAGSATRLP